MAPGAVRETRADGEPSANTKQRSSTHPSNLIEQDHRRAKSKITPMPGFKRSRTAALVTGGIELLMRIRKGQFTSVGGSFGSGARLLSGMQFWQPNEATASHGHNLSLVMLFLPEPSIPYGSGAPPTGPI